LYQSATALPVVIHRADDMIDMPEFYSHCQSADLYRGTPLDQARTPG
jgi:hypothetical protein